MMYDNPNRQTADEISQLLTQLTRIGFAIDKELTLISERMSWLVISESFIFSAFTVAVANQERVVILGLLAWIMPLVGFLQALFVYPALLAAARTAKRLKQERGQFELKLPEDLRLNLRASAREQVLGDVPTYVIPVMLGLVWTAIIIALALVQWPGH
jgi:hypothetical protein